MSDWSYLRNWSANVEMQVSPAQARMIKAHARTTVRSWKPGTWEHFQVAQDDRRGQAVARAGHHAVDLFDLRLREALSKLEGES